MFKAALCVRVCVCVCVCVCACACACVARISFTRTQPRNRHVTHIVPHAFDPLFVYIGTSNSPQATFSTLRNVCVNIFGWFCTCVRNGNFLTSDALALMQGPLYCAHRHPPLALDVFEPQEHTQSVGFASFDLCMRFDNVLNLQHAQHGTQNGLH